MSDTNSNYFIGGQFLTLGENQSDTFDRFAPIYWVVKEQYEGTVLAYNIHEENFEYVLIEDSWVDEKFNDWLIIMHGIMSYPLYCFVCMPNHRLATWSEKWTVNDHLLPAEDLKLGTPLLGVRTSRQASSINANDIQKSVTKVTEIRKINNSSRGYRIVIPNTHLLVVHDVLMAASEKRSVRS